MKWMRWVFCQIEYQHHFHFPGYKENIISSNTIATDTTSRDTKPTPTHHSNITLGSFYQLHLSAPRPHNLSIVTFTAVPNNVKLIHNNFFCFFIFWMLRWCRHVACSCLWTTSLSTSQGRHCPFRQTFCLFGGKTNWSSSPSPATSVGTGTKLTTRMKNQKRGWDTDTPLLNSIGQWNLDRNYLEFSENCNLVFAQWNHFSF